jgi:cytochrome c553
MDRLEECDLCGAAKLSRYIDGKTIYGPWAIMCIICHHNKGVGLGTGRGQYYVYLGKDKKYIKMGG